MEKVSDDVGILQNVLMKSTIRNITVINVVCDGADEQALDSNPRCILLIAQCVTVTTILLFLPCLCPGAACSPDSNDTTYRGIKHHKPHLHTHTQTCTLTPLQKGRARLAGSIRVYSS